MSFRRQNRRRIIEITKVAITASPASPAVPSEAANALGRDSDSETHVRDRVTSERAEPMLGVTA